MLDLPHDNNEQEGSKWGDLSLIRSVHMFIVCMFCIWLPLNNLCSSLANHLKFMHKVRYHKRWTNSNFSIYHIFCSGIMPLDLPKKTTSQLLSNVISALAVIAILLNNVFLPQYGIHKCLLLMTCCQFLYGRYVCVSGRRSPRCILRI